MQKLSKKGYLRIPPETFKQWITEIMKEPVFRYANAGVISVEIENRHGGLAKSHLHKIRAMTLNMKDFLPIK